MLKPWPFFWIANVVCVKEGVKLCIVVPYDNVVRVIELEFGDGGGEFLLDSTTMRFVNVQNAERRQPRESGFNSD